MANLKATTITGSLNIPYGSHTTRAGLTGNVSGSIFLVTDTDTSKSKLYIYSGIGGGQFGGWEELNPTDTPAFYYTNFINYSYLAGGYKDSSPWRDVHKTVNATDQTSHLGQLLANPASYTSGASSKTILYVWSINTNNIFNSATTSHGTTTGAINMITDAAYANQTSHNLVIGARADLGTVHKETEFAWMFGGGTTAVEKFNLTTETMYPNQNLTSINGATGAAGFSDKDYGYGWVDNAGMRCQFATDTFASSTQWGAHGQQKGISSKVGKGYGGNEGTYNGGYNLRRWQTSTETNLGNVSKPHGNCGEENFTLGQDWQYMLGNYDGAQNNTSWKFTYATDSGTTSVSGLAPGVNAGTSSGHCGQRT